MFRIGEFSKMARTTVKTLRFYDEVGLLTPACTDEFTGYRLYTTRQLLKLHRIQSLRQIGLTVDQTRKLMDGGDAAGILNGRRAQIADEIERMRQMLSQLDFILQKKEEENYMNYSATVKQIPKCTVYSKRMTVPNYDAYFDVIPALGEQVTKKYPDLKCTVPGYCFIMYLDGEYREKEINIEFCEAVNMMKPDFDGIVFKEVPEATVVSVMHKGPYASLSCAYAFAFKWMEENGFDLAGAPRESYIDGIWNKESEQDWLTELQFPIVKRQR